MRAASTASITAAILHDALSQRLPAEASAALPLSCRCGLPASWACFGTAPLTARCAAALSAARSVTMAMKEAHGKSVAGMKEKMQDLARSLGLPNPGAMGPKQ